MAIRALRRAVVYRNPAGPPAFAIQRHRSVLAVLAGLLLNSFANPMRTLFGVLGCYVTARLAPRRPMFHSMILGTFAQRRA